MEKDAQFELLSKVCEELQELKELILKQHELNNNGYVDIETICRSLKISKETLRRYRKQNLIPFYRVKGKVYFIESEVKNVLKQHYYGSKDSK